MFRLTVVQHGADVLFELECLGLVCVLPLQRLLAAAGLSLHQRLLQLGLARHLRHLATGHLNVICYMLSEAFIRFITLKM